MTADDLRAYGDEIVDGLLRENEHRWRSLQPDDRQLVEQLARDVAARLLSEPVRRMAPVHEQTIDDLFARSQSRSPRRRARVSS